MFHYNVTLHALVFFWELLTVVHYLYLLDLYWYHCYHYILLCLLQFLEVYVFNKLCKCI